MKLKNILQGLALSVLLAGCYSLDRSPEGVLSTVKPFQSTGEMRNYIDQFYETGLKQQGLTVGGGSFIAGSDTYSDNLSSNSMHTRLAGELSLGHATSLAYYRQIRDLNFFLGNLDNTPEKGSASYNQYVGEAYYFRAWYYFQMLVDYGPLTWLEVPLDPNLEEMRLPRDSRLVVVDKILADLDKAITLLQEQSNSASMRVHRDVARAFKSEVALFEATWERYHRADKTPFYDATISDDKIRNYLEQAVAAAEAIVARKVWSVYSTGKPEEDYRKIFQTTNLGNNPEVLWYKAYDGDKIGNNVNRYLNQGGGGIGVTASLVDDYLTRAGRPFLSPEKLEAKKVFGRELDPALRDPRLAQTVCRPGQQLRPDDSAPYYVVPPLVGSSAYNQNVTGYSLLKYVQIDYTGNLDAEFKGATPAIQYRYADVLLNYAEALAELGGAQYEAKIKELINPLRERVGMPGIDFDREYNTESDYPFRALDKYIQAIRRERRVEQAIEGRRFRDLMRWAAADEVLVGKRAMGVLFTGSDLAGHAKYGTSLKYDQASGNNLYLSGKPGDTYRYVLPINPADYPNGWQFRVDRDYLLPIHVNMISLTAGAWTQNPNW